MARISTIPRHVQAVRASLRQLERALGALAGLARRVEPGSKSAAPRKLKLSPARRRALKLQGRYLGYMRQLAPAQKSRVRATKEKSGMNAAIKLAKKLAAG